MATQERKRSSAERGSVNLRLSVDCWFCWWRRRESNLPAPFRFCNLLILQKEESAKRPTQACLSYNYRTICPVENRGAGNISGRGDSLLLVSLHPHRDALISFRVPQTTLGENPFVLIAYRETLFGRA